MKAAANRRAAAKEHQAETFACDTSVALAALDAAHEAHPACRRTLIELRPVLAGHAAFETHSVLTRLPLPLRLSPAQATSVLTAAFPGACWLAPEDSDELRQMLGDQGVAGGAVYDAVVGQAARANGHVLLTRDRRAERTYQALDVPYRFVD